MKVILLEEVRGKGGEGDVIDVARGFANNYLFKNHMAVAATKGNLKQLEQRREHIAQREELRISAAETRKGQLENMAVTLTMKVGEEGQLFGSVTTSMIADAIAEQNEGGVEVDRRRIDLHGAIKTVGEHEAEISLYRDIKAKIKVIVVDEDNPDGEVSDKADAKKTASTTKDDDKDSDAKDADSETEETPAADEADEADEAKAEADADAKADADKKADESAESAEESQPVNE